MRSIVYSLIASVTMAGSAGAGQPENWQIGLQDAATDRMIDISWFNSYTLIFIIPITLLVLGLLGYCALRFNAKANPEPATFSHNTPIEIIWTVGPVLVLIFLAVPSFQILDRQLTPPKDPEITIKATGVQWYWDFEYQVGEDPLTFSAILLKDEDREALGKQDKAKYPRLLAVDNEVVVPVNTTVRVLVTAGDVIHSLAMPAFGLKIDAVPGRVNETWFSANKEGLFYGQCSELCGKDHAYMPLAIRVVSKEQYETWYAAAATDLEAANKALVASIESENKLALAEKQPATTEPLN